MARTKVTLTLREVVGARSLSAAVDQAIAAHRRKVRHLAAVDRWLATLERAHGPVPPATIEWAAALVDEWDSKRLKRSRRAG